MRLPLARVAVAVVLASACSRDLSVPPPPDPSRPGTIQGTVVYAQAGLSVLQAATGATLTLVGSGVTATTDMTGHFLLKPISTATGTLLITLDADGDGMVDHQRQFDLTDIGAGPGHDISLDQIVLGSNATVRGTVLRADIATQPGGHAGTAVFVPEGPNTVYTGDNGGFTLENLPEGHITLAFFRQGYASSFASVDLRAGEVFSLAPVLLTPQPVVPGPAKVSGFALLAGQTSHAGITVTLGASGLTTTTDAAGRYAFAAVQRGVYSVGFTHDGYLTYVLRNILIDEDMVDLQTVTLVAGMSTPPDLDGGLQPFDAGPPPDAGTPDSGTPDAGTPDSGTPDAGPPDAGPPDSGMPDSGAPDAGPDDAGFDAGPPPLAVISGVPQFAGTNTNFTLHGDMSSGARPLVYHWRQDAGTAVTIQNNDTVLAATPSFFTPAQPTVLHFGLSVTDTYGRTSPSAEVSLPVVGAPPTAMISGAPMTAFSGAIVTLNGSGVDPSGTGIVAYNWSVSPGTVVGTPKNGGTQIDLAMPSSVPTPFVCTVQLTVTDGISVTSAPVSVSFNVQTMMVTPWYVDAGTAFVVNGGQMVTLNGLALAPGFSGATFSYLWSPAQTPDASVPDWQLTDPTSPITQFVAPIVAGPLRSMPFTLTANVTSSGLMPASNVGATLVLVQDKTPPQVVATSIDASGNGGMFSLWMDFSEPIDPTTLNSITINTPSGAGYPAPSLAARFADGQRVTLEIHGNISVGNAYVLLVQGVRDLAPQQNTMSLQQFPFVVPNPWSAVSVSAASSTVEPRPALIVRSTGSPNSVQALIAARKDNGGWFLAPFDPRTCTSGCTLNDDSVMPAASLSPQLIRGHRGYLAGTTAIASLQVHDYSGDAGITFSRDLSGPWTAMPLAPGQLSARASTPFASYAQNGLAIAAFDSTSQTWSLADAGIISAVAADFPADSASDPLVQASTGPMEDTMLVARTSKTGQLRFFRGPVAGGWQSYGSGVTSGSPVADLRIVALTPYTGAAWVTYVRQNGQLELSLYGDVGNGIGNFIPSGVSGFDTIYDTNVLWLAVSVNGLLQVEYLQTPGSGTWTNVPGVVRGGVTATDINNDPTCFADQPELAVQSGRLYVTWQERCGSGPWKVYFRSLN